MENILLLLCISITNIQSTFQILKPFLLLTLKCFSVNMYHITNKDKINYLRHKLKECICSSYTDDNKPVGVVLPKNMDYICYFPESTQGRSVYIFINNTKLTNILEQIHKPVIEKLIPQEIDCNQCMINYCYRMGDYNYFEYTKRKMYINSHIFSDQQKIVYDNIMRVYNEKNNVKCYLYGNVSSGKTFLAYLMARELNCYLCDTFNPTEPSDSFSNIYNLINPTPKKPLIILLDEADVMIKHIHYETIIPHKNNTIQVYNKTTWNSMLDKLDYGLYPNVILMLCSNVPHKDINKLDESYLREGRIDLVQHIISGHKSF